MSTLHNINMLAFNRKHHRRRREAQHRCTLRLVSSSPSSTLPLSPSQTVASIRSQRSCHKQATISQITFLILTIIYLLCPDALHPSRNSLSFAQQQQNFLLPGHNMENLHIPESQPVDSVVYQLKAGDRLNENRKFQYHMTGDTFSVDEFSGEVRLSKSLDRERQPIIVVVISVFDAGDSKSDLPVESKRRTIFIDDIDDSWPTFLQHRSSIQSATGLFQGYQIDLSESTPIGSIAIGEILVVDADEGPNAELVFECRVKQSTNQACDVFALESRRLTSGKYSVSIRTRQKLDFERVTNYKLSLVARGKRPSPLKGVPLETETIVMINILNVQDEGPQFVNAPYSLSMPENLKPGTRLLNLVVQDGDSTPQRDLSMIVVPGPYSDYFQVSKDSEQNNLWYLETNSTIDRESPLISGSGNMFVISLLAAELDETSSPVASEAELLNALRDPIYANGTLKKENVTILVLDSPDSTPMFVQASSGLPLRDNRFVMNISESLITGSSIPNLDLAVVDLDQGMNSRFNLSLIDPDTGPAASLAFGLDSEVIYGRSEIVLHVLNSSLLDYEIPEQRVYKFNLVASKNRNPSLAQILEMQFNVIDANDNSPEFERDQFVIDIPEGLAPGSLVAIIKAQDIDSGINGKIDYMLRGPGSSKFKLFSNEGRITVNECALTQCLDYETQPSFSLTYEARDGAGRTKNVSVIINLIDMNDHAPKFTEPVYKRDLISDNLSSKHNYISPQLIVRAIDGDGISGGKNNITYRISKSNLTSLDVDSVSGLVYLQQPLDLDGILAQQQQNSQSNQRSLNLESQDFNQRPQDKRIVFEAEVVAEDNGIPMRSSSAKILIVVKGNPDGAPQFKQDNYFAFVRENHPPNRTFFQVQATDPDDKDSQLRYSVGYDPNDLVAVGSQTAELSFKTKIDYDDFKGQLYNVTIYATDNSRPNPLQASTIVSIAIQDVNDKPPQFEEMEYKATVVQGRTKVGDLLLQVQARDVDMTALLNYSIITDMMSIRDRNGQEFSLNQLRNSTSGYLSHMSKTDRLAMVDGLTKFFTINKTTGSIELQSEPDYSLAGSITLVVEVTDLNQEISAQSTESQQARVNCTIFLQTHVDKSPIFASPWSIERQSYTLTIMEELPMGTTIFSLLAKDPTTNQRIETFEKIFESDQNDYFRVDRSGLVTINKRIDYEELAAHANSLNKSLSVSVKALNNEGFFSIANLLIRIIDLNDNAPQFKSQRYTAIVSEGATYPQEILSVSAEDKDSGDFGRVYYSISEGSLDLFSIDPKRGSISIRKGVRLDRDTMPSLFLMVTASDCNGTAAREPPSDMHHFMTSDSSLVFGSNCKKSSVQVDVTLEDTNDNEPVFMEVNKKGEFEAMIPETASIGSVVTEIQAIDQDEGPNGQVSYEIVAQGSTDQELASRLIKIDSFGVMSVAGSLSGMGRQSPYRITIRAYDHGKQSRQSYAHLLLTINDVVRNDGVPRFIRPRADEVVNLSESAGPGTAVYRVQAVDPDEETNGRLMYKFAQQTGDMFDIDPFTGLIKTQNRQNFYLDRELAPNYTLIVVAQDLGSPPKQAHQVLTIRITDVNDNEPYFERDLDDPPLELYVEEELAQDTLIGTIQAIDRDVGNNALIGYEIIDGNQNNLFRLSYDQPEATNSTDSDTSSAGNNPCRIYTTSRMDREARESYILTIKATSLSKLRSSFIHQLKDPLGSRNPFNKYNASDFTKIQVKINLMDINDNRPQFERPYTRSVVDSGAEIFSQLVEFKAHDADSSSSPILYSILDALFYSDARYRLSDESGFQFHAPSNLGVGSGQPQGVSVRHVFDLDPRTGILRNSIPLRPYIDGYFEIFVKADSGMYNQMAGGVSSADDMSQLAGSSGDRQQLMMGKCQDTSIETNLVKNSTSPGQPQNPFLDQESCFVAVAKATVFVTHQRETFRFVFNKTRLNDRLDEFKVKMQSALENLMFEPIAAQASTQGGDGSWAGIGGGQRQLDASSVQAAATPRAEKIYLNTFNTDFFEREDGSLDFSTLTSCSQLVKFDDRSASLSEPQASTMEGQQSDRVVPNQVISFEQALGLLRSLNASQTRQHKLAGGPSPLFNQYGLIGVERCTMDKTVNRMSLSERLAIYLALTIAFLGSLLAFVASRMRKSYERHLKLLQRSKYQYMNQYATMPPGAPLSPGHHQMSLGALQAAAAVANQNFMPPAAYATDYEGPVYDTWQL